MTNSLKAVAKGELVFTSFLFVVAAVVLVDTMGIEKSNAVGFVGPEVFAFMVGGLMLLLAGLQIIAVLRGQRGTPEGVEGGISVAEPNWKAFGILAVGLVLYTSLLEFFGFPIMGTILFFLVAKAIGSKNNIKLAVISVLVSAAIFVAFNEGLQLQLPSGLDTISRIQSPVTEVVPGEEVINDDGVVVEDQGEGDW